MEHSLPDFLVPAEPAWGLGDRRRRGTYGSVAVELPACTGPVEMASALALVLRRYDPGRVRFAVAAGFDDGPADISLVESELDADTSIHDLPAVVKPDPLVDVLAAPASIGLLIIDGESPYRPGGTPPFPITLAWARHSDDAARAWCWYDESYVCPPIAQQFALHLGRAAHAVVADAGRGGGTVGDVALMTPDEIAGVLAAGRTPAAALPPAATIHAAVEASARATPEAVAYRDNAVSLTYGELVAAAGSVAGALREAGVVASSRVGVCMTRGPEQIVVLLAILRTGAAYVPMDTRHPGERLRFTTQDAGINFVVTDFPGFPEVDGVRAVHPAHLRDTGAELPADDARPDDIAYVIYTSGSTGRPKGVAVPHRNVMALLAATAADMDLRCDDVWTWFHSAAFDFSVWEIWGALMTGATLVGVPYDVSRSVEDFHELLYSARVTVLNQTPSAFGALQGVDRARRSASGLRPGSPDAPNLALRLVIFGGETLDVSTLRDWFDVHPPERCRMVNMYGITETTVHVTTRTVTPLDVSLRSRSVGTALPGWSVSVRDERGRPVPFGVAGEVFVGGSGVAEGYLNRPDLTAERFIEDPHGAGRVYRSGDYGRLHPDGSLDHLGRIDSQVQLRGHRVELEEIRAILLEDPGVQAAAVVVGHAIHDDPASARIDAYVVTTSAVTGAELRGRASRLLPEYMVPNTVTVLDSLPLTVNGKVDVARLPAPGRPGPPAPRDGAGAGPLPAAADSSAHVRRILRRVWADVFNAEVADDDDFFELGGNSLLALRLSHGMRAAGLPPIALRDLYLHPRIEELLQLLVAHPPDR